jgi:hypothetical protein
LFHFDLVEPLITERSAMSPIPITPIDPHRVISMGEGDAFPLGIAARCLAQGDSWFSIGAFPPMATSNIINSLKLSKSVAVVNCARPGKELTLMVDAMKDPEFMRLLAHRTLAVEFDAILFSGGGNDLIAAAGVLPGAAKNRGEQLFLDETTRGAIKVPLAQYLSIPGWRAFSDHVTYCVNNVISARDNAINRHKPLYFHNYAYCVPRPEGAGLGFGPWLHPAMEAYNIPTEDRIGVARLLMDQLSSLLSSVIAEANKSDPACNVHLVETKELANLQLSAQDSGGESGDWINEIHPSWNGYAKLVEVWRQTLDQVL